MTAGFAANYLTATMVCFFIGRFTGTWLIRRFAPHNVLAIYAFIAMLLSCSPPSAAATSVCWP